MFSQEVFPRLFTHREQFTGPQNGLLGGGGQHMSSRPLDLRPTEAGLPGGSVVST